MNVYNDYFYQFFKNMYHYELDRRDNIEQSLTYIISVITVICGVGIYFLNNLPFFESLFWSIAFFISYFLLMESILISTYFFIRTVHNYSYGYIPKPKEIDDDINKFEKYYLDINTNENEIPELIEEDIRNFLISWYIEASQKNTVNNDLKSYFRHMTYNSIIISFIFFILSSLVFFINKFI